MKTHAFLISVLVGAISALALTAGEQPRQSQADDPKKVQKVSEEEQERTLEKLGRHCQKMLDMQIAVHEGTTSLHEVIEGTDEKKPRPEDQQAALKLAANEKDIAREATKVIDMLEAELASLVAFPEVFRELRKDMKRVQRRLRNSDVGDETQAIERDIIQTLKEMIWSLKKR
jgi:hypothetical protein